MTSSLKRVRAILAIVAVGLFVSGVTIWPWEVELELALSILGSLSAPEALTDMLERLLADMRRLRDEGSFVLYVADWLAFAHLVLAALFVMAMKDPIRNILVVRFGLLCCAGVPILAIIFVPIRGIPLFWIAVDSSFALAALPLWIALRDLRKLEASGTTPSADPLPPSRSSPR